MVRKIEIITNQDIILVIKKLNEKTQNLSNPLPNIGEIFNLYKSFATHNYIERGNTDFFNPNDETINEDKQS